MHTLVGGLGLQRPQAHRYKKVDTKAWYNERKTPNSQKQKQAKVPVLNDNSVGTATRYPQHAGRPTVVVGIAFKP